MARLLRAAFHTRRAAKGPMKNITKLILINFKRFDTLDLELDPTMNILIGDNEAGKSTILLALDLALSASRTKVESFGLEPLFNKKAVDGFLAKPVKRRADLPILSVELFLPDHGRHDLNGKGNSLNDYHEGLRFSCEPSPDYIPEIEAVLREDQANFPFEFYEIKFTTFAGQAYGSHRKFVRHLAIDSSQINSEHATRDYTRTLYAVQADAANRNRHENLYRRAKDNFKADNFGEINGKMQNLEFALRSTQKSNMASDLIIMEGGIPIDGRGKGRQSLIKTEFALRRKTEAAQALDAVLLEEPENHLSHVSMRWLLERIAGAEGRQVFIATHSSMVCSRLNLRKATMLHAGGVPVNLRLLSDDTADFFCKAPDNKVLEFAMSAKAILVEGDAEFILISELYAAVTGSDLERDRVHVISVDGTSFKRYLDVATILGNRVAVICDNDRDHQAKCVDRFADYHAKNIKVFADKDPERWTFEVCVYEDNKVACDEIFEPGRKTLSVQDYMLANKTETALALLKEKKGQLVAPAYLREAIEWINA